MARHVYSRAVIEHDKHNSWDSNESNKIWLSTIKTGSTHCELRNGMKSDNTISFVLCFCWVIIPNKPSTPVPTVTIY